MLTTLLTSGVHANDFGLLADRLALGTFFAISGFHKIASPQRRLTLAKTFKHDGVYARPLMWAVPLGEIAGGLGVASGLLAVPAALGLVALCFGACLIDGLKRIPAWKPLDAADYLDDVLYLPEVLYMVMAGLIIAAGPGVYSLDHLIFA